MQTKQPQDEGRTEFAKFGLIVCGLMLLYPPWTETPGKVFVGDYPVHYGGREVDYVSEYKIDPHSPIRKNTEPEYQFLWDSPTKKC